ncbi:TetR/AcrR family transcriptional regulator C-terminal domain-containing protein [Actinospica robiniae]|uniref:TetR/AcrR family transcriptional regulator C-terminal domain-containing protein n=1 Tax=Actinospica robiniae TaxID=304901 RepID=UPI000409B0CE|nr:TetR/AcrR family transcriptional regulator C-terminal domain-containing protein [Actinospica robiniae]
MSTDRPRGPGQRAGLTRQAVLDHALDYVDRRGLSALTMRALGAELGVEAMTLYHYVPTKDALLDGMLERSFTLATPALSADADASSWQQGLREFAHGLRQGLLRHPGILPLATSRPAVTPETLDRVEVYLRMLTHAGFDLGRALHMINTLVLLVVGHVAAETQVTRQAEAGGAEWLSALDPARYPLMVEAAATGRGTDDAERFAFAVDCLITGFAHSAS